MRGRNLSIWEDGRIMAFDEEGHLTLEIDDDEDGDVVVWVGKGRSVTVIPIDIQGVGTQGLKRKLEELKKQKEV